VLDEPTSGLDTLVRREFLEGMVDIAAAGRTVFLSSHQINEVERVADIVGIMRHGQLVLVERLDDLKSQIRELTITLAENLPVMPSIDGRILRERRHHQQLQILVRGASDEAIATFSSHALIREMKIRTPSLEEIFVAYLELAERGETAERAKTEASVR
jgi:ABC-2 type transport system ATP-binding protein